MYTCEPVVIGEITKCKKVGLVVSEETQKCNSFELVVGEKRRYLPFTPILTVFLSVYKKLFTR